MEDLTTVLKFSKLKVHEREKDVNILDHRNTVLKKSMLTFLATQYRALEDSVPSDSLGLLSFVLFSVAALIDLTLN